jgi:streptogramin lyase
MKARISAILNISKYSWAAVLLVALAAYLYSPRAKSLAADESLLGGRITVPGGAALAGIPIQAHRDNSNVTVSAYTNSRGEYSFPAWSDLSFGSYSVAIELPEFVPFTRKAVDLVRGKTARVDIALQSRAPSANDASAAEIAMGMPGTEEQKYMLTQCGQCHSLQFALKTARTKEGWLKIVAEMAAGLAKDDPPSTKAFEQKRYIEPLAEYLASIRGPGSAGDLPVKLRSRPTSDASTRIVVTEYAIPRGGTRDLMVARGDRRFAWPHDVLVDPNGQYVWYSDQFACMLGRLDRKTGEVKEFRFPVPARRQRSNAEFDSAGPDPRGANGIGTHTIHFLPDGNIVFSLSGSGGGMGIFNPKTEEFKMLPIGSGVFFGVDPSGNIWYLSGGENRGSTRLNRFDMKTGEVKGWTTPPHAGGYDVAVDSNGRFVYNGWRTSLIGVFDPKTENFAEYPVPTPQSGPRRGEFDAKGRYWTGLFYGGRLAMFDPDKGEVKDFPLIPDVKPFGAPFLAAYCASVDDKNQIVWTEDFNSGRVYRFDMNTEKATEFFMPSFYEMRNIATDKFADRPTVWIPAYRPASKIVKIQLW